MNPSPSPSVSTTATLRTSATTDIPVLISGAGPTGLLAGILLVKMGIPCRIIERDFEISKLSKALGIHARTLEILQMTDPHLLQRFLDQGNYISSLRAYYSGKLAADVTPNPGTESHFCYPLMLEQSKTVTILSEEFERAGGCIDRGWELMDTKVVEMNDLEGNSRTCVETVIRRAVNGSNKREGESKVLGTIEWDDDEKDKEYETQMVRSDYLIGADGGRSAIRHKLNIPFPGRTRDYSLILFDGPLDTELSTHHVTFINGDNNRSIGMFPIRDNRMRIMLDNGTLTPEEFEVQKSKTLTVEEFQRLLNETAKPLKMNVVGVNWLTYYRVNERRALEFSYKRRIFLAGDAAHTHSPAGGQGMNTGLQDAYNLAWKLALVINGTAPPPLLDSYQEERPAIADQIIQFSANALENALGQSFWPSLIRRIAIMLAPLIMPFIATTTPTVSMLGLRYHENSINKRHHSQKPPSGHGSVGTRARDGILEPYSSISGAAGENAPTLRLHELMAHPGVFQVLVFASDLLDQDPERADAMLKNIENNLGAWRSRWPGTTKLSVNDHARPQFMIHVISAAALSEGTSSLVTKAAGEGKLYQDSMGALHKKYNIVAKAASRFSKNDGLSGAIVVVRPDSYIGYRVQGLGRPAWEDVDDYFRSILTVTESKA